MNIPFLCKLNGRRALNGERFSITLDGTAEPEEADATTFADSGTDACDPDITIYDTARNLIDHLEEQAATVSMQMPDSLQITLGPAKGTIL